LAGSIVLDTRRVGRANASAARLLLDLREEAALAGIRLLVAGCSPALRMELDGTPPRWPADGFVCDTDQALEQCEDELLVELRGFRMPAGQQVPASELDILRDLEPDDAAAVVQLLETSDYAAGDSIVDEGDAADRLYFLVAGAATVRIGLTDQVDGSRRISTLEPGAAFGEAAILQGGRRTASVVADEPTTIRSLSVASIERLAEERPAVHAHIIACVGRNLYGMLGRTLAEVRALL
jgi:glutaminase